MIIIQHKGKVVATMLQTLDNQVILKSNFNVVKVHQNKIETTYEII
jgi:hypothetical protein